jgi:hypothetical protein
VVSNPVEFLAMHAIATMPDSVAARKRLLGEVAGALPRHSATRQTAKAILYSMSQQDNLQKRLALTFSRVVEREDEEGHHNGQGTGGAR